MPSKKSLKPKMVINPLTSRSIRVGGATYKKVVQQLTGCSKTKRPATKVAGNQKAVSKKKRRQAGCGCMSKTPVVHRLNDDDEDEL
jgi:hypothetical protein